MKSVQRHICLVLVCALCFVPLFTKAHGEEVVIWEMAYPYCESELGYTRDELTPNQYVHYEDGSWDFSLYVKDAEPMTNGLVIGSLDSNGKLIEIKGPVPISTAVWLNDQVSKYMFDYRELYLFKKQWEPKLDDLPEQDMALLNSAKSFNPLLDFLRLNMVLPDEKCISYEEAKQKTIDIIEAMDGWTPEMTEHVDIIVELIYIPDGMDHPVWQFIYTLASSAFRQKAVCSEKECTDEISKQFDRMFEEENIVFGENLPCVISIRIDAYSGEQIGETYIETPPVSGIGYTGIVLWK